MTDEGSTPVVRFLRGIDEIPAGWGECVVTVGVFDGVHRGHQQVVRQTVVRGRALGLPAVAVTFDPRPVEVLAPDKSPQMLTTVPTRVRLLGDCGADVVVALRFTPEFSQLGPEDFVRATLVDALRARAVVVGEDFRFGHRAAGDVALLATLGGSWGFAVEGVAAVGEQDAPYSSSVVRRSVAAGDVSTAARLLGRPHFVEGTVERGDGRGHAMGYPTANVASVPGIAIPADGVYAGRLHRSGEHGTEGLPAAVSIGTNPTFAGEERRVEAYVLDRDDLELYDEQVSVEFVARLRETVRFESAAELVAEMDRDVRRAREILVEEAGVDVGGSEASPAHQGETS